MVSRNGRVQRVQPNPTADQGFAPCPPTLMNLPGWEQPIDIVAHKVAALFKPAVIGIDSLMNGVDHLGGGRPQEGGDVGMGGRAVGLESQKIIATAVQDGLSDGSSHQGNP